MKKEQFEAFLSTNEKRIFRYLWNLCANEQDAMDILQSVFIAVYQNIEKIEEATALAYTYKIAHNKCMTFLKQNSRYIQVEPSSFNSIPDRSAAEPETDYSKLQTAVKALPPKLAVVIQLQYYDKLSYKEISEALGISVKAVESLLVRAKRILRKKMLQDNAREQV
ncbi:MAG: RNA polymerase sigma factor [Candidatus Cloacimonas sp.]|jgi:RNA polymerase sigma-70 factor (ECF subfamily)|nr:RNA polymerase sigma factor [Candidatus Cloacimonas sp.]